MATRHELDGMFDQLREILVRISFINAENPDYWLNNLRRFFTRLQLRAGEVAIIRGLCRQVDWYAEKRYRDGLETARGAAGVPPEPGCKPSNGKTSP
jgi:tRNA/rRNA methyltransferase